MTLVLKYKVIFVVVKINGVDNKHIKSFLTSTVIQFSQFSHSVVSDSFQPHELQHARPPCPSPTPRVHSNSCPSNRWCHPAISDSGVPFSSGPQSLPASESFPMSQLFAIRWPKYWSFSFSIIPSKEIPGLISFRMDRLDLLKQRHYFANKGYGFSCGHVWMWELDCEEGWAPKNWYFWTVVLEKTLESPLDCKEMAGWHHWLNGHESEWTGVGDGQGGLVCCNSWGHKE